MEPDPTTFYLPQLGTVLFAILILYEQYELYKVDPANWKRAANATAWGVHVLVFYACIYLDSVNFIDFHDITPIFFTLWSVFLRLHSAMAFYYIVKSTRTFTIITRATQSILSRYNVSTELKYNNDESVNDDYST